MHGVPGSAALAFAADAGNGGGHASDCETLPSNEHQWWCERWEGDLVEEVFAVALILLAMAFEKLSHHCEKSAEESYVYGMSLLSDDAKEAKMHARVFGRPLVGSLFHRMNGEFMCLGFLALTVWILNQLQFMDLLAEIRISGLHLPHTGHEYLELAEEVHIRLFVAMVFYFALALRAAHGSNRYLNDLEEMRGTWVAQLKAGGPSEVFEEDPPSLRTFKLWRMHFLRTGVSHILKWRVENPGAFHEILESMGLHGAPADLTLEELQDAFQGCFSFATYLACTVREATENLIHLEIPTMAAILVQKAALAAAHFIWHRKLYDILPLIDVVCLGVILTVWSFTWRVQRALEIDWDLEPGPERAREPGARLQLPRCINFERFVLRVLQCLMFFSTYGLAGDLLSEFFWQDICNGDWRRAFLEVLPSLACVVVLYLILPALVPRFTSVTALPPFFNYANQKMVVRVMLAGGAKGACWAPYIDEKNLSMVQARSRQGILQAVREIVEGITVQEGLEELNCPGPKTVALEGIVVEDLLHLMVCYENKPEVAEEDRDVTVAERMVLLQRELKKRMLLKAGNSSKSVHSAISEPSSEKREIRSVPRVVVSSYSEPLMGMSISSLVDSSSSSS